MQGGTAPPADTPRPPLPRLSEHYTVGALLGKGSFAVVKEALKIETGRRYAVKMIDTTNRAFEMSALRKEIDTMQRIDHINCIHLHGVFEEDKYICLVLDLVTGGELFDRIIARGHYSEKDAAEVSREVLLAVAHMHARGIVHRDLKPENLLYISNDENTPEYKHIKVADFGLARHQGPTNPMRTTCGTPGYVAPEVLDPRLWGPSGYGPAIDVWSIGVVLYILLCGFPPFYSENTSTLFRQIRRGDYSFPSPYWDCISDSAKDLVRRMLVVDPSKRLTAEQCLQHRWIVNASLQEDKALGAQHRAFLLIRRLPLFEQVDPSCLAEVTKRLKRVTVKAHEFVIRSGEEGTCMYFVGANPNHTIGSSVYLAEDLARGIQISKCLSVLVDGKEVTQLGTGDYFGEVALMSRSDHKRTADVEARCTCELFALSREDVMEIIKNFPILEARLQSMAEARLKRAQCASKSGSSTSLQNSSFSESDNLYVRSHAAVSHQTVSQQTVPMNIALESPTPQAQQAEQPTPQPKQQWNSLPLGTASQTPCLPTGLPMALPMGVSISAPTSAPVSSLYGGHIGAGNLGSVLTSHGNHTQQISSHGPSYGSYFPPGHTAGIGGPSASRMNHAHVLLSAHLGLRDVEPVCNPADQALRNRALFTRLPSKHYLACPEAVPRIEGLLRMNSTLGVIDDVFLNSIGYGGTHDRLPSEGGVIPAWILSDSTSPPECAARAGILPNSVSALSSQALGSIVGAPVSLGLDASTPGYPVRGDESAGYPDRARKRSKTTS